MGKEIHSASERKNWFIYDGYIHRANVFLDGNIIFNEAFPLKKYIDGPPWLKSYDEIQYQLGIYEYSANLLEEITEKKILDIGCGNGRKTIDFFREAEIIGLEIEPILSYLKDKYPSITWLESDFENPPQGFFPIIICSDVIEHIVDPDDLLDFIAKINFGICVISTPDRNTLQNRPGRSWDSNAGPPRNSTHLREWSYEEFSSYIGSRFHIIDHRHCDEVDYKSQLVCFRNISINE